LLVTWSDCDNIGTFTCFLVNGRNAPVERCFELKRPLELLIELFACSASPLSNGPHCSSGNAPLCRKESRYVDLQEKQSIYFSKTGS
jgi:hypothetical protein